MLALIERSSFIFNFAEEGGALYTGGDVVTILRNATLFNNNTSSADSGTAISATDDAIVAVYHSSMLNNGSGIAADVGLKARSDAAVSLTHTIVATNWSTSAHCAATDGATIESTGYTLDSGSSCSGHLSDLDNSDPQLGALTAFNPPGAPFDQAVLIPMEESPVIDGGTPGSCPGPLGGSTTVDQRNRPPPVSAPSASPPSRGTGPICDIGAIEFQPDDAQTIFSDRFEQS